MPGCGRPSDPGRAPVFGRPAGPGHPSGSADYVNYAKYVNPSEDPVPSAGPGRSPPPPDDRGGAPPDEDEDGRIGIFPSWKALYVSVIVYTAGLIALLYVFTVLLDTSAR